MTIKGMKYSGIPQVINKQPTTVFTLNGTFRQPYNLMNPTINISGETVLGHLRENRVNYFEIDDKFYYIMDWQVNVNNLVEVKLHLDVLKTYRAEINKMQVMLDRSSSADDEYVVDSMMPFSTKKIIKTVKLPNKFEADEESGTYIVVTNQSGYTPVGEYNGD